jgi:hypothetical protein
MSNPCLNRWGSNIFWKAFWYSDNHYSANVQQDRFFETLILTYLFYGLRLNINPFVNPFWYNNNKFSVEWRLPNREKVYYRWNTKYDLLTEGPIYYQTRTKAKDLYLMRIWILKFVKFIVLNLYWFQPFKKKKSIRKSVKDINFFKTPENPRSSLLKRLKLIILKSYFKDWDSRSPYLF